MCTTRATRFPSEVSVGAAHDLPNKWHPNFGHSFWAFQGGADIEMVRKLSRGRMTFPPKSPLSYLQSIQPNHKGFHNKTESEVELTIKYNLDFLGLASLHV